MKCKVFNESRVNLENETNNWLTDNKNIEIKHVQQTESSDNGYMTLTIFYTTLKRTRKEKLNKIEQNN